MLRIPSAIFAANGSSGVAIRAPPDSIGHPWPIDPTSEAVFGELKGGSNSNPVLKPNNLRPGAPLRLAEVFGFGRVNPAGTPDLVQWSLDGDSGRPVGKDECRGNPKGKPAGGALSFGYLFFGQAKTNSPGANLCCGADPKGKSQGRDLQK